MNGLKSLATISVLNEDFQYFSFLMAKSLVLQVNITAGPIPACEYRLSHDIAAIYSLIPLPSQGLLGS